jgi:hypothetical protein
MLQEWPSSVTKLMAAEIESVESPEIPQQKAAVPPPQSASTGVRFLDLLETPEVADVDHPKLIMEHPKSRQIEDFMNSKTMDRAKRFIQFLSDHILRF